jgi:hypothetical protein
MHPEMKYQHYTVTSDEHFETAEKNLIPKRKVAIALNQ